MIGYIENFSLHPIYYRCYIKVLSWESSSLNPALEVKKNKSLNFSLRYDNNNFLNNSLAIMEGESYPQGQNQLHTSLGIVILSL